MTHKSVISLFILGVTTGTILLAAFRVRCVDTGTPPFIPVSTALPYISASRTLAVRPPNPPSGIYRHIRNRLESSKNPSGTPVPLPRLEVSGMSILRTDTGQPVVLKGASSDVFRDPELPADSLIPNLNTLRTHGANIIGLYLQPEPTRSRITLLDSVVSWTQEHGMYVYLMPVVNKADTGTHSPFDRQYDQLMEFLSQRYANYHHILYGLGAEPGSIAPAAWRKREIDLAAAVRKHRPDAVLLLTGTTYGRDFGYLIGHPLPIANAVLFLEYYPRESPQDVPTRLQPSIQEAIPDVGMPYFFGEFGGVWKTGFGSDEDTDTIQSVVDFANAVSAGYTMFRIEPYTSVPDELANLSIVTGRGTPTRKGQIFQNDLYEYPPTLMSMEPSQSQSSPPGALCKLLTALASVQNIISRARSVFRLSP